MNESRHFKFILQRSILLLLLIFPFFAAAQTSFKRADQLNEELLNQFILLEINKLRKKERVDPLENKSELLPAAQDHADYMLSKHKLTHKQRFNKEKKTPKNRVDHYGRLFDKVGENVQIGNLRFGARPDDKKNPPITTYEKLAFELVVNWMRSPMHYRNMVSPEFESTYTAIAVNAEGQMYVCQLFGGTIYQVHYKEQVDTLAYKPENPRRCRFCASRVPLGWVEVTPNNEILYVYRTRLRFPTYSQSRMRLFNPWNDGLAANIVLKSQFPCDSSNYKNGRRAVTGIPLAPVYRKDFHIGVFRTEIYLGKVPDYVDEDYEVNVTVVKNKRTCSEMMFNIIPSAYYVDIPLTLNIETETLDKKEYLFDTITASLFFGKAKIEPVDTAVLRSVSEFISLNQSNIHNISLEGYASIEGSTEKNIQLYTQRAQYLRNYLVKSGIDDKLISTKVNENFADFREDVQETDFAYLAELSNQELKKALEDPALEKKLEPFLARHRYVHVKIITKDTLEIRITKEMVQQMFAQALETKNRSAAVKLQKAQYDLIFKGEMNIEDLDQVEIPNIKRFKLLLHNDAIIHFLVDSLNTKRYLELEDALNGLKEVDSTFQRVRTNLAILEYYRYREGNSDLSHKEYFQKLKKLRYVDKTVQARIILNFASGTDWQHKRLRKKYYNRVKTYIQPAKLDVDKTFEVASYYSYFHQNKYAYSLIKDKIDETDNPADLIYFLKLISLTNVSLSRDKYLAYFRKILQYSGDEFCTFFNSPNLNFQILNDLEVKEIYCRKCEGVLRTKE